MSPNFNTVTSVEKSDEAFRQSFKFRKQFEDRRIEAMQISNLLTKIEEGSSSDQACFRLFETLWCGE